MSNNSSSETVSAIRDSMYRRTTIKSKRRSTKGLKNWHHFNDDITEKYCTTFFIQPENIIKNKKDNYVLFSFQIKSLLDTELSYSIEKRFSDFVKIRKILDKKF